MNSPSPAEVRAVRMENHLTQVAAAAMVHVTPNAWEKWEQGARRMPPATWELFLLKLKKLKK